MDKLGGRKFIVLLAMLVAGGLADHFGKAGLSTNLVYLMLGLYGAFTAGNVGVTLRALKTGASLQDTVETRQDEAEVITSQPDVVSLEQDNNIYPLPAVNSAPVDLEPVHQTLARLEASMGQVVAAIPPQNQSLGFLVQSEQRRQMKEITG